MGDESGPLPLGPPSTVKWAPPTELPAFGDTSGGTAGPDESAGPQPDEPASPRLTPTDSTAPTPLFRDSLFADPLFADLSPGEVGPVEFTPGGYAAGDEPEAPAPWPVSPEPAGPDPASYLPAGQGIYDRPPADGEPEPGLPGPPEPGGYLADEPAAGDYLAGGPGPGADDYPRDEPGPASYPLAGAEPAGAGLTGSGLTGSGPPDPEWPDPGPGQGGSDPADEETEEPDVFRSWFEPPEGDEPAGPEPSGPEPSGPSSFDPAPFDPAPFDPAPFDHEQFSPEPASHEPFDPQPFSPPPSLRPFGSGLPAAGLPAAGPAEGEPFGTDPFRSGTASQGPDGSGPAEPDWGEADPAGPVPAPSASSAAGPGAGLTDAAATSPLPASHELEDPDFADPPPKGGTPAPGDAAPGDAAPGEGPSGYAPSGYATPGYAPSGYAAPGLAAPGQPAAGDPAAGAPGAPVPGAQAPGQPAAGRVVLEDPDFADPPLADSVPDETPDEDSEDDEDDDVLNSPPVLGAVPPGTVMAGAGEKLAGLRGLRALQFDWVVGVIALATFGAYTALSVFRYLQLSVGSWDLGIYTEYVRQLAHLHAPVVPIRSAGFNLLGDHFQPIVALIAPFFRLFPSPVTLLVAQALLTALSVVPVCRAAQELLGTTASRMIGVAYGFSWGLQQMIIFDFHEVAFAVPLLACSLSALLRGRPRAAVLWALPLVFVKEDQGLTAAAIGVVMLTVAARRAGEGRLAGRPRSWRVSGGLLAAWGLAWSLLAVTVIIPHFNVAHHYQYWHDGGVLGPGGHFSITGLFGQFAHAGGQKLQTLVLLLLPAAFLALRSPLTLIALPAVALRFLSTNSAFWGTGWHYNATIMPIVFIAAVDAVAGFAYLSVRSGPVSRAGRGHRASRAGQRPAGPSPVVVRYGAAVMLVIAVVLAFWFPVRGLWSPQTYQVSQHVRAEDQAAARVPPGTTAEATLNLLAPLAARDDTSWVGTNGISAPRYIVYDGSDSGWSPPPAHPLRFLERSHPGTHYQRIFAENNVYVFRLQVPPGG